MPRNVEIKARVADPALLRARALELADGPPEVIEQTDTFFAVGHGRLKVRAFADGSGELIHYDRPVSDGPKTSNYALAPTTDARRLGEVLALALERGAEVRKRRELIMVGRTRIHLDEVAGLGHFMELEVVMGDIEPESAGEAEAAELMEKLGIIPGDLVEGAYVDMLDSKAAPPR